MVAPTRLLLVDDHPVVLFGLKVLFAEDPRRLVVAEAPNRMVALRQMAEAAPDIVILDLVLGGRDGIELLRELLAIRAQARIIVYSSQDERIYAGRALQAGASGYVSKAEDFSTVAAAVEAVARGRLFFSEAASSQLLRGVARGGADPYAALSDRELQIFRLIGQGLPPRAIAEALSLSVKTIGTYRERLKVKLGLEGARELERAAFLQAAAPPEPE